MPASDGGTFEVVDPATGGLLASVSSGTVGDAIACVDAAAAAAAEWAATPPRQRSEILRRTHELLVERADDLALLISAENGKALPDARGEVLYSAEFFRWYAEEAVRVRGEIQTAPSGANRIIVLRQPVGVAVLVTPWNFPAAMAARKIAPALAAGCTTILKPAGETPLTALAIADLMEEAGLPAGVVNVLPSRRSGEVVAAMLADPRVRKLSFTGSTEVGRTLLNLANEHIVNCSMELGGNAPFVVFDDADIDAAVEGAMVAKMRNGGEACTAANRFFVQEGIAAEFATRLAEAMSALTMGPGYSSGTTLGPLVNAKTRDKVASLVEQALSAGAEARIGGVIPDGPGFFYPATVLTNVAPDAEILQSEIFGPVAPVVTFRTDDEAIDLANNTEYGLVSYVYTTDLARGLRVSEAVEAGMVGLNRGLVSDPAAPFGGVKESGLGREGGTDGLLAFTESKYIAVAW
ncbi:NAD-dependent succinate-semialdehyde dehydrogenase [Terrabacter terrigena]|uniref:NAD-dependent succinate-semialdehyde dehydrogenase n=1 Tax=Terrabacter terrigena TaxID=574718 RepID=A0ABW3N563_9MICO